MISVKARSRREQTSNVAIIQGLNAFSIRADTRCRVVSNERQVTNMAPHACLQFEVRTGNEKAQTVATHKNWIPERLDVVRNSRLCFFHYKSAQSNMRA